MRKPIPEIKIISGIPLGADSDEQNGTEFVVFVLEDGDHLHVEMNRGGLDTLFRHIEHAREKARAASAPRKGN